MCWTSHPSNAFDSLLFVLCDPAALKLTRPELREPLIAQQGFDFRASPQAQPDWSQVWLIVQFEGEERTTGSFLSHERHDPVEPFRLAWKLEGIAVFKLL